MNLRIDPFADGGTAPVPIRVDATSAARQSFLHCQAFPIPWFALRVWTVQRCDSPAAPGVVSATPPVRGATVLAPDGASPARFPARCAVGGSRPPVARRLADAGSPRPALRPSV